MASTRRGWMVSLGAAAAAATAASVRAGVLRDADPARWPTPGASGADGEAFLRAVEAGDLGEVRRFLGKDALLARACDAQGRSAFVLAHLAGRTAVAEELRSRIEIDPGLDIVETVFAADWPAFAALAAAHPEQCDALHAIGGTPLYASALAGSLEQWRLRAAGCRNDVVPAGGSGFTPARAAMSCRTISGAFCAATELLGNGSDVNAPQHEGDSVLHGAVRRRSELLVRLAVRKGADVASRDRAGRTPQALAEHLEWAEGARLLADHHALPRDHRASRWLFDANRRPIVRADLADVPRELQNEVTGSSHMQLERVRALVAADERLVFSVSSADELAIEACAHTGNREIIRFHLEHGAPLSLPTAISLGDHDTIRFLLDRDPLLIHERGAHDFPVMWYAALGGGGVETAALAAFLWCVARPGEPRHHDPALVRPARPA
jgi:ankyrin repeat protein